MSYVLGQYNKNKDVQDDNLFMTLITDGEAKRRENSGDSELEGGSLTFYDECLKFSSNLDSSSNYYFHGKIKRMTSNQIFYIKLVYYSPSTQEEEVEQYIKTVEIAKGDPDEWVDVEFIFTPLLSFNCLLFELKRDTTDFRIETRYPLIDYEEVSLVNNIISSKIARGVKLIKIGVQSRPGLLMCINGEEIRTCRTGIYELKNGVMTISFFSVVTAAKESGDSMSDWIRDINNRIDVINQKEESGEITPLEAEELKKVINSKAFLETDKTRSIDSFTLDYMYRENE